MLPSFKHDIPVLHLKDINKSFEKTTLLENINLSFYSGQICSILGENGAGKTTLIKILSGLIQPDSGEIFIDGKKICIKTPALAQKAGIHFIFQESSLVPFLTVEQNVFLGREIQRRYFINYAKHLEIYAQTMNFLGQNIEPSIHVSELSPFQKLVIELAKALVSKVRLLLLDEVTVALNAEETAAFFQIIEKISRQGTCTIFISQKLGDVLHFSQRMILIQDGLITADLPNNETAGSEKIIKLMVGKNSKNRYPRTPAPKGALLLQTVHASNASRSVRDINLKLHEGEIVGVTGSNESHKEMLAQMLIGTEKVCYGTLEVNGRNVSFKNPHEALKKDIAFLSGDSRNNLFFEQNSFFNITVPNLQLLSHAGILSIRKIEHTADTYLQKLHARINPRQKVRILSTGNQQKVAFSKILFTSCRILILENPSANLDIPSKVELYNIMNTLAHRKCGILLFSSDVQELNGMCDRIYFMDSGIITRELKYDDIKIKNFFTQA